MNKEAQVINDNFLHHATFLQSLTPEMDMVIKEGLSYSDSGLSSDTFNIIYITGNNLQPATLAEAIHHFDKKQFEFCIWINEENRTEQVINLFNTLELQQAGADPGMILHLDKLEAREFSADIRKANTKTELEIFAQIVSQNWQPPDQNVMRYYDRVSGAIFNKGDIQYYLYYLDGDPVAAVELFPDTVENAGLYSLCTLTHARGKGIGTALMSYCLQALKAQGYKTVALQASDDGLRIYKRLGFEEKTRFYEYKR